MIAAELRGGNKPSLNEALGWIGSRVDDIYGAGVGRLEDVWIDPGTGIPRWLLVKEGRFGGRTTLIPFEDATAGAGHVWIPYERDVVRDAPEVEPGAPLTQQVEASLRSHYAANAAAAVAHSGQSAPVATSGVAANRQPPGPQPHHFPPQQMGPPPPQPAQSGAHFQQQSAPQAPVQRSVEAGSPAALGMPVPPPASPRPQYTAHPQPPQHAGPQAPAPAQPRPPQQGAAFGSPPPMRPPAPPARPSAAPRGAVPPAAQHQARPQQPPVAAAPSPAPPQAVQAVPDPVSPVRAVAPTDEPSPPVQGAPHSDDGPDASRSANEAVAIPVIHSLDQPYMVEIEFEGGLKISGKLKNFSIAPATDEG